MSLNLKDRRWSPMLCNQFFEERPWNVVTEFFRNAVAGNNFLCDLLLFPSEKGSHDFQESGDSSETSSSEVPVALTSHLGYKDFQNGLNIASVKWRKGGRWERKTFQIELAYFGSEYEGWQAQPGLHTVQGILEKILGTLVESSLSSSSDSGKLAQVSVAGRTDKGVHALGQICSFYTWKKDATSSQVKDLLLSTLPWSIRVLNVLEVPRSFHPVFSAKWRRYIYLLPLNENEGGPHMSLWKDSWFEGKELSQPIDLPVGVHVALIDAMLRSLEGKLLNFSAFARDTTSNRSSGPATECHLYKAQASIVLLPNHEKGNPVRAMMIDLVGNRFLRRMVRVLVSTAVREAAFGVWPGGLLSLTKVDQRRATAPPAPPQGLCLAQVGYTEFGSRN